jgi:predicted nucleic acid-binding protein
MILVDTYVFVRHCHADDPDNAAARRAIHLLGHAGNQLAVAPQSIYEF